MLARQIQQPVREIVYRSRGLMSYLSVHTSAEALRQGEAEIRRIGRELRADGTLRRSPVMLGGPSKAREVS